MSDPAKPDRWNSVLETLGVPAPPPEASKTESEQPAARSAPPPRPAERTKPAPKPKSPPKPPGNWSSVAASLGLEVPPEPPRPAAPPPPTRPAPPPAARQAPPPRAVAQPAPPAAKTPLADLFGEKPLDVDVFGLGEPPAEHRPRDERRPQVEPRAPGPPPAMLDDDEDEGPVLDYDLDSDLDLDLDSDSEVEEPQKPPPPRSEDRQRSERPSDRPRDEREGGGRRRRRGRGRGRRDEGRRDEGRRDEGRMEEAPRTGHAPPQPRRERDDELPPPPDELDDIFGETIDLDDEEAVDLAQPPTEERARSGQRGERAEREDREEGGGRRRRRRRGRGGRGRTEEGRGAPREAGYAERRESRTPPAPGPETEVEPLDLEDYGEEPPAARDYRQPAPPRAAASDADELDLEPEESDDREGGHAVHKKIPTWDDAVGILIDANMAARANSPDRSRHSRGGRGGRGR